MSFRNPQDDGCLGGVGDLALATLDPGFLNRRIRHVIASATLPSRSKAPYGAPRCMYAYHVGWDCVASIHPLPIPDTRSAARLWSGSLRNAVHGLSGVKKATDG